MSDATTELRRCVDVVLGAQWGDEGKGKLIDSLAGNYTYVARCAGGNNAGHTIVTPTGTKLDFHLLPSGLAHEGVLNVVGNGCVVHLKSLLIELEKCLKWGIPDAESRMIISNRAQIVFDFHQSIDRIQEERKGKAKIGTTLKGIGPCYSTKADRSGVRMCDLVSKNFSHFAAKFKNAVKSAQGKYPELEVDVESELAEYEKLATRFRPMVQDTITLLNNAITKQNETVLVEGANATMLDIDFGTYPYVTSSNCSVGGACTGLGLPPAFLGNIYGVTKAYATRVGTGPFPSEQGPHDGCGSAISKPEMDITDASTPDQVGEWLQRKGFEYGTTTKRARRCGWIDLVALRYAHRINHFTAFAMTKLDVMDGLPKVALCNSYTLNGEKIDYFPADVNELEECTADFTYFEGWTEDTTKCQSFKELPENAQKFVLECEKRLGVPIRWVGIGPGRDAMITRF